MRRDTPWGERNVWERDEEREGTSQLSRGFQKDFFAVVMSHVLNNVAGCALFFSFLSFLF